MMAYSRVKNKLGLIRDASSDVKSQIDEILKRDNRIEIATVKSDAYAEDLYRLLRKMAKIANPVLEAMGLDHVLISKDIEEFVEILENNTHSMYFASVNIEAKYSKNKYALKNLSNWFKRLDDAIEKIEGFLEMETESRELKGLFTMMDETDLSPEKKEELKEEFLKALNRLNT